MFEIALHSIGILETLTKYVVNIILQFPTTNSEVIKLRQGLYYKGQEHIVGS